MDGWMGWKDEEETVEWDRSMDSDDRNSRMMRIGKCTSIDGKDQGERASSLTYHSRQLGCIVHISLLLIH